jgi:hypothetical protein
MLMKLSAISSPLPMPSADSSDHPDKDPAFWCEWSAPRSEIAKAIQFPIDNNWSGRLIGAYLKDEREARKQRGLHDERHDAVRANAKTRPG